MEYLDWQREARHAHISKFLELEEHHQLREARFVKIARQQQAAQCHQASLGNEEQHHVLAPTTILPQQLQHVLSPLQCYHSNNNIHYIFKELVMNCTWSHNPCMTFGMKLVILIQTSMTRRNISMNLRLKCS